jgi:uncharacterized membrane protein
MPFDAPHIHLMVNHVPIILAIAGLVATIVALVTRQRSAWLYAVATLTVAGLSAYPVHFTGDLAADVMKHKWYVVKDSIEAHDNFSGITMWILMVTGAASAYAWWRLARQGGEEPTPGWLRVFILVGALAGTGAGAYTAYLGGEIVYGSPRLVSPPGAVGAPQPAAGAVGP